MKGDIGHNNVSNADRCQMKGDVGQMLSTTRHWSLSIKCELMGAKASLLGKDRF